MSHLSETWCSLTLSLALPLPSGTPAGLDVAASARWASAGVCGQACAGRRVWADTGSLQQIEKQPYDVTFMKLSVFHSLSS